MKKLPRILFIVMLVIAFSCEDNEYVTNCDDCTSDEPVETVIRAKLNYGNHENGVLIKLYEGKLEDKVLHDSVRIFYSAKYEKKVPLNKTYTVTATYYINGKTYTITDSTTPRVKYTETLCEEPCYFVYNTKLNLEYKYLK